MPFGLRNMTAMFQRFMDHILRDVIDKYVGTCIDDIIIKTRPFFGHKEKAKQVMAKLGEVFVKAVHLFLGLTLFFCHFIPCYSAKAKLLNF